MKLSNARTNEPTSDTWMPIRKTTTWDSAGLKPYVAFDIVAKIASCVVIFFYLVILAISIIINRMEAFYTLSAVGGAMAIIIGYITNNKKN